MRRFLVWALGVLAVGIAALFAAVAVLDTETRAVPAVVPGYTFGALDVAHRDETLPVHIWYPARQGTDATPELIAQNALFYGHHVLRDVVPADGLHPVIVLSHGSGGNAAQLGWLIAPLVDAGAIVIGTDHPGTRSRDSDPFQTVNVWERPADMTALLDHILNDAPLGMRADPDRIAALGFSLGGHSALSLAGLRVNHALFMEYCEAYAGLVDCGWMQAAGVDFTTIDTARYEQSNRDARLRAVVAIDPALPRAVPDDGTQDITVETLILNLGALDTVPAAMRADALADRIETAQFVAIDGAWHFSFLMECSALGRIVIATAGEDNICSDRGLRPRADIHAEVISRVRAFLIDALRL